jgi:hypothetical protein
MQMVPEGNTLWVQSKLFLRNIVLLRARVKFNREFYREPE